MELTQTKALFAQICSPVTRRVLVAAIFSAAPSLSPVEAFSNYGLPLRSSVSSKVL